MQNFSFGNYNSSNTDIALSSDKGYVGPAGELDSRKQLSYPLKELKDYINNTVATVGSEVIRLYVDPSLHTISYRTSPSGPTTPIKTNAEPFSFVGMVVSGTNLLSESNVKAIYGDTTSWRRISSVALASEHIFGNGLALGLSNGNETKIGLGRNAMSENNNITVTANNAFYGKNVGTSKTGNNGATGSSVGIGVVTKEEAGDNPSYSGLVADTITVYMWERTA